MNFEDYLKAFNDVAPQWFADNRDMVARYYRFFQKFFTREHLDSLTWPDVQAIGDHTHAFKSMAIARGNALGNPNHPIDHYRTSFEYLAFGEDDLPTRIDRFVNDEQYRIAYFGPSITSEILGYLFAEQFVPFNTRDKFALKLLNIGPGFARGDSFATKYVKFNEAIKPVIKQYREIVGAQTDLPLNLEIDQFFSYLYETYQPDPENPYHIPAKKLDVLLDRFQMRFPDFVDFQNPGETLLKEELEPKRGHLQKFREAGGADHVRRMLEEGNADEALKTFSRRTGNIVQFNSWKASFGDDDTQVIPILTAFLDVAEQPYEGPEMVKPIFQAIKANGVKPAWDTLSAVLWLLRPEDYAPIKISYYRMLAKELDFALPESRPTPKAFAEVLAWMNGFRQAIQGLEPNDWVDVQSFIWGVLPDEEEARTTANSGQDQGRYWVISAGNEKVWPEFRDSGFVAIGWPELGDLTRYDGPTAFETALQKLSGDKKARLNDRLACEEFVRGMQVGDHVFAKLGSKRILGFGKVTSEYRHEGKGDLPNRRDVEWLWSGSVELPRGAWVPLKTLTNVSEYYHFLNHILPIVRKTSSSGDDMSNSDSPTHYWWLNANPRIWDFDAVDIGERQFYTAYNEKGNKRRIFKYFEQAQPGDIVVGYQTSPLRAITAICRITQGLHDRDGVPSIEFEKVESLTTPVPLETFRSQPGMQHCEVVINNQGSLFRLTEDEYDIIRAFIDESEVAISTDSVRPYDKTDAMKDLFLDETLFDTILDLLRFKKNIILQGPPGVGKSFIAKRLAYTLMKEKDDSRVEMVQFHQSYSYEDFIQGYRPGEDGHFVLRNGSFYEFCRRAARQSDKPFVFIIDEINRGNLSKIFGELMLLIEHDKRGADHALPLTYSRSGDDRFHIPDHVHLIGMMNTADRSLAMVDYALRRRFNFVDLEPCFASPRFEAYLKDRGVPERLIQRIVRNMEALNREISKDNTHLGPRYRIGHSFFCPPHKDDFFPDETWYEWVVEYDIAPLLREYWFDNSDLVDGHLERLRG